MEGGAVALPAPAVPQSVLVALTRISSIVGGFFTGVHPYFDQQAVASAQQLPPTRRGPQFHFDTVDDLGMDILELNISSPNCSTPDEFVEVGLGQFKLRIAGLSRLQLYYVWGLLSGLVVARVRRWLQVKSSRIRRWLRRQIARQYAPPQGSGSKYQLQAWL